MSKKLKDRFLKDIDISIKLVDDVNPFKRRFSGSNPD